MIPGMSGLMSDGMEKQGVERLKRFMTVMDSMTNPKQMMQQLQSTMDPKMLSKLGGAGNMMEMMKQMSSNEGAMGEMMRNMQQAQKQMKAGKKHTLTVTWSSRFWQQSCLFQMTTLLI